MGPEAMCMLWTQQTTETYSGAPSNIQGGIFASPMVVNGQLYIAGGGTDHTIRAFGL